MSTTQEMLDDEELAKTYIVNSDLSDDYKKTYLKLLKLSTTATNGISPEEKIQKMTEAIQLLAITQGMFMVGMDQRINASIEKANGKQCKNCKAMQHTIQYERQQDDEDRFNTYLISMGIDPKNPKGSQKEEGQINIQSWSDIAKTVLQKPYIYVIIGLMTISPFGVEIVKALLQVFGK